MNHKEHALGELELRPLHAKEALQCLLHSILFLRAPNVVRPREVLRFLSLCCWKWEGWREGGREEGSQEGGTSLMSCAACALDAEVAWHYSLPCVFALSCLYGAWRGLLICGVWVRGGSKEMNRRTRDARHIRTQCLTYPPLCNNNKTGALQASPTLLPQSRTPLLFLLLFFLPLVGRLFPGPSGRGGGQRH